MILKIFDGEAFYSFLFLIVFINVCKATPVNLLIGCPLVLFRVEDEMTETFKTEPDLAQKYMLLTRSLSDLSFVFCIKYTLFYGYNAL
jgi:hypothetical protein